MRFQLALVARVDSCMRFRGPLLPVRERSCIRWRADIATAATWAPRWYPGELRRKLRRTAARPACSCHRQSGTRASRGWPAAAPTSPRQLPRGASLVVVEHRDEIRTCDTRFRNGSSVTRCVYGLTCWSVSVIPDSGSFRNGFAVRRTVDVVSRRTVRLIAGLQCHRIRLTGQLVRPALRQQRQRSDAGGLTGRNALAATPSFSLLLNV
jgi:hypothetical protein